LVESFLNSIDLESGRDDLASPVRFRAWLIAHGHPEAADDLSPDDLLFAREIRDALREEVRVHAEADRAAPAPEAVRPTSQASGPAAQTVGRAPQIAGPAPQPVGPAPHARLNALAARVSLRAIFTPDGLGVLPAEDGVRGVLGEVLGAAVIADQEGRWQRLKICREGHCQIAFYDRSKNSSRCWCSMSVCGNRNKTRAYRGRRRSEARAAAASSVELYWLEREASVRGR
jgi:hypothetical protein